MRSGDDEILRLGALHHLGPLAPPLAREALETGVTEIVPDVLAWTGSTGEVRGHRVVLWLDPELRARVDEAPSVVDVLTAAIASAVATTAGNALAELNIEGRPMTAPRGAPYRGRF